MPRQVLALDDIVDLRAYERVRDEYRRRIIEMKRRRRVALGPILTLVFESVETVRFQVQEMARAERIATDEGIEHELEVYNRLLPGEDELSATLFVELTSEEELRHWLPRLVGIERAVAFELGEPVRVAVGSVAEASHADALTRKDVTAAVHYVRFAFDPEARRLLAEGAPAALVSRHPEYQARAELADAIRGELLSDLEGRTEALPLA